MDLSKDFVFGVQSGTGDGRHAQGLAATDVLAPLKGLIGKWEGRGFNLIWRPFHDTTGGPQDRFLELNMTEETLEFEEIPGDIPNRGFLQPDLVGPTGLRGLRYLQQIKDANDPHKIGIHIEPGLWISVPSTSNPAEHSTVARMASIPHGTTLLAQGTASNVTPGAPPIPKASITPFLIQPPHTPVTTFPEPHLNVPSAFRTPPAMMAGITQAMVNDPNSILATVIAGQTIVSARTLKISSRVSATSVPDAGGGNANIAFLVGKAPGGPNAVTSLVEATFWLEEVKGADGAPDVHQLQYTQTVLLDFNNLSWPHVSVATLRKVPAGAGA